MKPKPDSVRRDWVMMIAGRKEAMYLVQATQDEAARFAIALRTPNEETFISMEAVESLESEG